MLTLKDIASAHERICSFIHRTPVLTNNSLNELTGANLFFKCENFQKAGSFKIRGATNTVELLSQDEMDKGVATTSSGNHGAALSMAVTRRGGKTKVVMPHNTPKIKVNNVERNGGKVVWCEPDQSSREQVLADLVNETGATVVHPYNDERIIAGAKIVIPADKLLCIKNKRAVNVLVFKSNLVFLITTSSRNFKNCSINSFRLHVLGLLSTIANVLKPKELSIDVYL